VCYLEQSHRVVNVEEANTHVHSNLISGTHEVLSGI
jgi:hypothetical protein